MTTYFVDNHYEVADGVITKYYFAGTQRIAMRKGLALTYILSDHLGSTSLMTNASGAVLSETRYTAWGEIRYQAGTTSTGYTYTGQYSNTADFGLMYYNARWYDPALGRFAQADSIVPAGVQGYDRYAYVNNNPVRYTDPSGHCSIEGDDWCYDSPVTPTPTSTPTRTPTPTSTPTRTPNSTSTPTVTPTNCPLAVIECLPTSTNTTTPTSTLTRKQIIGDTIVSGVSTAVAIVEENCLTPGSSCGRDFLDPIVSSKSPDFAYKYGNIGRAIDLAITADHFINGPVSDAMDSGLRNMVEGWGNSTPKQRIKTATFTVVVILIVVPGFIPP